MIWEGSVELKKGTGGISAAVQTVTMFVISVEVQAIDKHFPFKLIKKLYLLGFTGLGSLLEIKSVILLASFANIRHILREITFKYAGSM
jgi:hypothetical protein